MDCSKATRFWLQIDGSGATMLLWELVGCFWLFRAWKRLSYSMWLSDSEGFGGSADGPIFGSVSETKEGASENSNMTFRSSSS